MKSLYEQLESMTTLVADTGELLAIEEFRPQDATTNPSLITAAAKMEEYTGVVDDALAWARTEAGDDGFGLGRTPRSGDRAPAGRHC